DGIRDDLVTGVQTCALPILLGTREINVEKLPASSRNWVNEKLIYTHGYGLTMNTANGFDAEGMPKFILSNMPVESTAPEVKVMRSEERRVGKEGRTRVE